MRYGILGDVHANLEALEVVLEALSKDKIDAYVAVGDIVGYGADPEPCIDLVQALNPVIVGGNHDWGVAGLSSWGYLLKRTRLPVSKSCSA